MKGTVPRPRGPAPAANTATRPEQTERPIDPSNRITLAILEESSVARAKGYDPYNKSASSPRPTDVWHRKRKRD